MKNQPNHQDIQIQDINIIICVAGNDGTGKSTICHKINQQLRNSRKDIYCIQRSHKNCIKEFNPLLNQLKTLDKLTYNYAFQKQREEFQKMNSLVLNFTDKNGESKSKQIKVYWFMLDLQPQKIKKRLKSRKIVDIYDSKKAVQYYHHIYRQFSWYYGIPLVYADQPSNQIIQQFLGMIESKACQTISKLAFKSINLQFIEKNNIENRIFKQLEKSECQLSEIFGLVKADISNSQIKDFYLACNQFKQFLEFDSNQYSQRHRQLQLKLCSRWLVKNGSFSFNQESQLVIHYFNVIQSLTKSLKINDFDRQFPYLKIYQQGQSKILLSIHSQNPIVQNYLKGKVIILLKSTIYSHTKQHTGQILNLGKIRALGNILFLQMIRRNNLKHAYLCINHQNGIILSQLVQTNKLEIVFKKQCLGTDKHSYYSLNQIPQIVNQQNNCYSTGVYIRFDWRNANHILIKKPNLMINTDLYYYVIQKYYGKQNFFQLFLANEELVKPVGDKCITQDVLSQYAPTKAIKKSALRLYTTFLYYTRKVGLEILDGCFMFDKSGEIGWSEINPDCMRIKSIKSKQDYDKDIWRYGGSSKKQDIVQKWTTFNKIFIDWFKSNRYHQTQMLQLSELSYPYQQVCRSILQQNPKISQQYQSYYRQLSSGRWDKKIIGTIDISNNKPILVKSSQITQSHTQSLQKAYQYVSLLQDVVLVDIDAAIDKTPPKQYHKQNQQTQSQADLQFLRFNRSQIKELVQKDRNKIYGIGGGIRSKQVLDFYLNKVKCKKIILSSCLQLLKCLKPQDIKSRVIVELSINQNNQVLIKGRSQNTHQNIIHKILELVQLGVNTISITFNHRQGHLNGIPRKQLVDLYSQIPQCVENIIIAGGITSIDDLNFIWGFKRCIPQLGSAIWKNKISIAEIYQSLVKFNSKGLVVAIIVDENQNILGQIYLNSQALKLTCQTRQLWRYSRQHRKIMRKGETSNNILDVKNLKLDCDNDSIIIKVTRSSLNSNQDHLNKFNFCHKNQFSCFSQNLIKNQLNSLQQHIRNRKETGSGYSKKMMDFQGFAAMKMIQEVQQLHISQKNKTKQAADLIAHLLMYLNAHHISMDTILTELQQRTMDTIKIQNRDQINFKNELPVNKEQNVITKTINVGIISGKHFDRIDRLTQKMIGIKLLRAQNRSSKINFQIVNDQLYKKIFGSSKINIIGIKSKDMSTVVAKNIVTKCVNYSIMMQNYPTICKQILKVPTPGIYLGLLGRKNQQVNPKQWSQKKKGLIICEYPYSVNRYFNSIGIPQQYYTLVRVSGGTESYLVSQENSKADFCDAIVQSGRTIQDNQLKVVAVLDQLIYAGFYETI